MNSSDKGSSQDVQDQALDHDDADDPQAPEVLYLRQVLGVDLGGLDQQAKTAPEEASI